jgi:hypothetical protein
MSTTRRAKRKLRGRFDLAHRIASVYKLAHISIPLRGITIAPLRKPVLVIAIVQLVRQHHIRTLAIHRVIRHSLTERSAPGRQIRLILREPPQDIMRSMDLAIATGILTTQR